MYEGRGTEFSFEDPVQRMGPRCQPTYVLRGVLVFTVKLKIVIEVIDDYMTVNRIET